MSKDIDWQLVSERVTFSFVLIFIVLLGTSFFLFVVYIVYIHFHLNNTRNKLVDREKTLLVQYRKGHEKYQKYPEITAYVNVPQNKSEDRPQSTDTIKTMISAETANKFKAEAKKPPEMTIKSESVPDMKSQNGKNRSNV